MTDPGAKDADPDAKDYKWLIARERGEDIGHVPAAERAPYERLGALLGGGMAPSAGWKQRVLGAIGAAEPAGKPAPAPAATAAPATVADDPVAAGEQATAGPPVTGSVVSIESRRRRLRWIAGGLAAAAAVALVWSSIPGSRRAAPTELVELATEVRPGGVVVRGDPQRRGDQASVGDELVVRAEATGPVELRVYGGSGERLLAACHDGGGCAVTRDGERRRFVLEVPLDTPGTVRAVVFFGARIPASTGALGPDLERAAGAKIQTKLGTQKRVL